MKLLILTCLVAAAFAMPRLHSRNAVSSQTQQQHSSSEEIFKQPKYLNLNQEFVNNMNRQRALLTEQNDEIKEQAMASAQEDSSISSSSEESEEAIPNITEQKNIANEDMLNQCTLEQLQRQFKYNQLLQKASLAKQASLFQQPSLVQQASLFQQPSLLQQASLFQQPSMAQQASLLQQLLLAQQPSLALQVSPAQQSSLVQQAFLAQQASLAQKHHPRLSQSYYPHMEQPYRMNAYSQVQMRHPMSVVDQALAQFSVQPFPQIFQYDAFPLWAYFPQDMQYLTPKAVLNTFKPIVSKDTEKTNVW
ncbi:alpha-S1-casein isoform b precursor [Mus musculus]|uniref:Alpha-S1-casein n=1 Tax=Mus musculus TaxID=10090 RepID=Q99JM6_MOUSE|nr:alpha-S1-casein isoform b precursor [Mus musculus]AAH06024.1 Csn1s1 protein [Mus musculus]|eukprot:NP_001272944.1 alpha-S1-casein isoform b precursor [Mus musculus]